MGLISASSLGQPIIKIKHNNNKINNNLLNNSNVLSNNKLLLSSSSFSSNNIMAPALTTELSAEHRKRSLSNDVKIFPKLDSDNINSNRHLRQTQQQQTTTNNIISTGGFNNLNTLDIPKDTSQQQQQQQQQNEEDLSFKTTDDQGERGFLRDAEDVLGHNVDEILQVLESMEGGKCTSNAGEESMLQLLGSELGLLPDMDVTDHSQEQPASPIPKVRAEDRVVEVTGRQHLLERRCDRLMRRARKLQARGTAKHSAHQLQELVTCARALLKARNASHRSHASTQATKEQLLDSEQVKNMSAAALVSLVKQISNTPQQGLAQALSTKQAEDLENGAGSMLFRLHHIESALDSDVTASSSGGDSCDEASGFNPNHTGIAPICKRAAWRYARDRASVVGRWTWLQANISDLEYRIRQYSECHRQLRANKGPVRLEPLTKSATGDEQQQTQQVVLNGFHSEVAAEDDDSETACRTRPLDVKAFRKRKLVVPGVLLPKSGKRCYPPHNQPPCCRDANSMPCILCFSKRAAAANGAAPSREVTGREGCKERAARLDPAIHPVLSGASDISRSLHMAAQLRQPGWQQTQLRQKGLARLGLGLKRTKAATEALVPPRRKYTMHKKNNNSTAANVLSAKIRRKAKNRKRLRGRPAQDTNNDGIDRIKRNRRLQRHSMASSEGGMEGDYGVASPSQLSERQPRRKRESSYDIDNIVIPYSMAALTRVERLEYKEIPTPKWRVAEITPLNRKGSAIKNGVVRARSSSSTSEMPAYTDESSIEDISEDVIARRHEPLEMEERIKFRCPPTSARGLRARRTDSRAESSGANTPDPMSPNPAGLDIGDSPLASPRATPPSVLPDDSSNSSKVGGKTSQGGSKPLTNRRRTYQRPVSPDPLPALFEPSIPPFEQRIFPLTEDEVHHMLSGMPPELLPPSEINTAPPSPCGTDSTESAIPEDEDPEWTLDCEPPDPPLSRTPARK